MTYADTAVAIFCKAPILGNVKTRLAADVGPKQATKIYRALAEHVVWNVRHAGLPTVLFIDKEQTAEAFHNWLGGDLEVQTGGDLGEKMLNATQTIIKAGYKRVIIVGTDSPYLDTQIVHDAAVQLEKFDVVLGPAVDGGYYLIGMSGLHPELFENMKWSTDRVLEDTTQRAKESNLTVHLLKTLIDIDTKEDLDTVLAEAPPGHDDFTRRAHLILQHTTTS